MQLPRRMRQGIPGKALQQEKTKREHRLTSVLSLSICDFFVCPPAAAVDCLRRQVQRIAHLRVTLTPHVALNDARRLVLGQLKR